MGRGTAPPHLPRIPIALPQFRETVSPRSGAKKRPGAGGQNRVPEKRILFGAIALASNL